MSLLTKIASRTRVHIIPRSKRKHLIFDGSMSEGVPRIWDSVADAWVYVRPLIMQKYGIERTSNHAMPSCGNPACISPTCLREGQTMTLNEIPKPIVTSDIFSLAQSGGFHAVADNLDSLSVSVAGRQMIPTGEVPRFVGQRVNTTSELFE